MAFKDLDNIHQENLIKLQRYMVSTYGTTRFDDHFHMEVFQADGEDEDISLITEHYCNTSACLLGHGPMAGIPVRDDHLDIRGYVLWGSYSDSLTGMDMMDKSWDFLFNEEWSNDIQEAITRLTMYIDGFDPHQEEWSYNDTYTK